MQSRHVSHQSYCVDGLALSLLPSLKPSRLCSLTPASTPTAHRECCTASQQLTEGVLHSFRGLERHCDADRGETASDTFFAEQREAFEAGKPSFLEQALFGC